MVIDSDKPEYALPGARYEVAISSRRARKVRKHTFSVKPQERTSGFPFGEDTTLEEPLSRSLVMSTTRNVVVSRRVRRREPSEKILS